MHTHLWQWLGVLWVVWGTVIYLAIKVRQRAVIGPVAFYGAVLLGCSVLIFCGVSCKQPPPTTQAEERFPDSRDATVAIMTQAEVWRFDDSTSQGFGDLALDEKPVCSGFAVRSGPGAAGVKIITAAHCLYGAGVGKDVIYVTRAQWTHTARAHKIARVAYADLGLDRAVLVPVVLDDATELARVGLDWGAVRPDSEVFSWGAMFDYARLDGRVGSQVWGPAGSYYVTDLDVDHGWSGSPVIDGRGLVVGVLVSCAIADPRSHCKHHSGNFVDLVALDGVSK